ncbi:MAG TPA: amidohydrolase family protein [Ohtaekwangia sp.]|uniref:amidohydrolase family protein n=1 Tax=Ohtaekwangia sp. TaxID=2066019 RepID=UPI002F939B40
MKRLLASSIFILLVVQYITVLAQDIVNSRQREIVITHVNVIPMDKEQVLQDQTVVVKDGKIISVSKQAKYSKGALIINAPGKYLIPGLAEMHAHVPPIDDIEPMKEVLALFAANGITTIRGMLGHPKHLELRSKIQQGEILGPHLYTTGPSFNGMSVTSPEAGAEMVRKQKAAGYDYLKLHPGLTRAKFDAIAATAKEVGIPFVGHVSFGVGVWHAIDAGYSSIDHLDGFIEGIVPGIETMNEQQTGLFGMYVASQADTARIPALTKALHDKHIWVVPTQSLAERWFAPNFTPDVFLTEPETKYMKAETVNQWAETKKNLLNNPQYNTAMAENFIRLRRKLIASCLQAGVGLLLGCDAPQVFNVPGFSTHNELQFMVRSGLTPYQALQAGTVNVARYLNKPDAGIIKAGAIADLVLIDGNPLNDISQTKKIEGVMLDGKWLSKEYIADSLQKLVK